ncbi:MAG TPA: hypothetical protein VK737_08755 [Opitutales bacterium]|jgi:hypothetical protein|nr:hypothetical protein [Opitutales bacterium]
MKSLSRCTLPIFAAAFALPTLTGFAQTAPATAPAAKPYKIIQTTQIPATGGLDYIAADSVNRRVYSAGGSVVNVFDLDTYKLVGTLPNASGHGVALDPEDHTGLVSGTNAVFFNTTTLTPIKTVSAPGADGYLYDPFTHHFIILSHGAPNLHYFDSKDGSDVGTTDAIGPNDSNANVEQGVTDGQGNLYFDCSTQSCIAVVDAKTMKVTGHYDLGSSGGGAAGLAIDAKNHILFAMCRGAGGRGAPAGGAAASGPTCVILSATDGKIITTLPLAGGSDGAVFNPNTMEAFSSSGGGNGTLSIIKENSPTDFVVEDTVTTKTNAKCCTLDTKTNNIIVHTTEAAPRPAAPAASASASAASAMAPTSAAPATASAAPAPAAASASAAPMAASASGGRRGGGRGPVGPQNLDIIFIGRDSAK